MSRNAFEAKGQSGIYKIENRYNHKVYIGQAKDIAKRMSQHINNHNAKKDSIDEAINQLGTNTFTYEVVLLCEEEQLDYNEAYQIYAYDSKDNGYNKTIGNHVEKLYEGLVKESHKITAKLFKEIKDNFTCIKKSGLRFLLIGCFDNRILDYLDMNDCTYYIISDDYDKELTTMAEKDFDIVISNPPYGKVGREVTHNIIENIDYKSFINLLPANDYARDKDLYKYVDIKSMKPVNNGFKDAVVTTHMALINKKPCLYISKEEFEIENYIDDSLTKYFYENVNREHYAIDKAFYPYLNNDIVKTFNNDTMLTIWQRDVANTHLPYKKSANSYKWNVEKSIDSTYFIQHCFATSTQQSIGAFCIFNTSIEKDNIVRFLYSINGFKFMSKVFTAMNCDSGIVKLSKFMPKVDWTREWTVEEILADYGYSEKEIKEVMDDLDNFKYMDD